MAKSGSNHASAIIEAKETFATLQELSNLLNTGKKGLLIHNLAFSKINSSLSAS